MLTLRRPHLFPASGTLCSMSSVPEACSSGGLFERNQIDIARRAYPICRHPPLSDTSTPLATPDDHHSKPLFNGCSTAIVPRSPARLHSISYNPSDDADLYSRSKTEPLNPNAYAQQIGDRHELSVRRRQFSDGRRFVGSGVVGFLGKALGVKKSYCSSLCLASTSLFNQHPSFLKSSQDGCCKSRVPSLCELDRSECESD